MAPAQLELLIDELRLEAMDLDRRAQTTDNLNERECLERCRQLAVTCGTLAHMQLSTREQIQGLASRMAALEKHHG